MRHGRRRFTIPGLGVSALVLGAHPRAAASADSASLASGPPTIDQFLGAPSAIDDDRKR